MAATLCAASASVQLISGKHPSRWIEKTGPQVTRIPVPAFPGAHAIWGSTGRDSSGHVWFGVSAVGNPEPSAHLFEHDPATGHTTDRGNVVDQLKLTGVWRPGEHQAKIHSRIVQGPDNFVYFASMDEEGETEDGSRGPTWGGHLWRLKMGADRWQHLFSAPEALIAVANGDRFVYALGYYGHVLYQYDTQTGASKHVEVFSVDGHVSRNFVVDFRGHAFVPRLRAETTRLDARRVRVSMVEFDTALREVQETPLDSSHYLHDDNPTQSHGITGIQEMADRSWYFTTHVGFLFHIVPPGTAGSGADANKAADVVSVSWFHPNGRTYVASLFTPDGSKTLVGLAHDNLVAGGQSGYQWLTCDVVAVACREAPFEIAGTATNVLSGASLYGSTTRDQSGDYYVVGAIPSENGGSGPVVLRVHPRTAQ